MKIDLSDIFIIGIIILFVVTMIESYIKDPIWFFETTKIFGIFLFIVIIWFGSAWMIFNGHKYVLFETRGNK